MSFDHYTLEIELGRGASGVVYRARNNTTREKVAIKVIKLPPISGPGVLPSPDPQIPADKFALLRRKEVTMRFAREQRLTASLGQADGFIACLEYGETPDRNVFIVMPFITGGTLRQRLQNERALPVETTIELGKRLAGSMGLAHSRGIVHRDLKPENILFTSSGFPLIADLGLAKHFDREATGASASIGLSETGQMRGTYGYMPIEQMEDSKSVGPTADVFALGSIIYECLTGVRPFAAPTAVEVYARVSAGTFQPVRQLRPETPEWLESVVARCLGADPQTRYSSGAGLAIALEQRMANPPLSSETHGRGLGDRRSKLLLIIGILAGAVLAVALGAIGGLALLSHGPPSIKPPVDASVPSPSASPKQPPSPPRVDPGWAGETLFPGMTRDPEIGVYRWHTGRGIEIQMVYVPPGDFLMGSSDSDAPADQKPQHRHQIADGYWIGRYEITWHEYRAFCHQTGAQEPENPPWGARDSHPVVNVDWEQAVAFCTWAGVKLPTEAQWERAARGTDGRLFPWGDRMDPDHPAANVNDESCPDPVTWRNPRIHDGFPYTAPVGSFREGMSPVGALDMAGNVAEWCDDWYDDGAYARYARGDLSAPLGGAKRVIRGGSWWHPWWDATATQRNASKSGQYPSLGFRVVKIRPQ